MRFWLTNIIIDGGERIYDHALKYLRYPDHGRLGSYGSISSEEAHPQEKYLKDRF